MLQFDELEHLHVISDRSEQLRSNGVGHLGGKALTQRPVPQKRSQRLILELGQQLVLAAGYGEDHGAAGANGTVESDVGRRVTGVQADDEIDTGECVVAGDVADFEPKPVRAELPGQRLAVIDDIGLEVEPDDLDVPIVKCSEEMMERKREVGLARAEIDDPDGPAGRDGRTSSTSSRKRFTCRNLSYRCDRTLPSRVITPSSTRNGTGTPSGRRRRFVRS